MPGEDWEGSRLRELLRDARWSLPARPDAEARVRQVARRQRLRVAGITAGLGVVVAAAIVVPLTVTGGHGPAPGSRPAASPSASPNPTAWFALPAVGALGFPVSIYPPPQPHRVVNTIGYCPSTQGLQPFPAQDGAAARNITSVLGRSFDGDLHLTDRSYWPVIASFWQQGSAQPGTVPTVLYSGPLNAYRSSSRPPDLAGPIAAGCGAHLAQDTWMIVEGQKSSPALQGEYLFLDRQGHILVYFDQ
jgi:hypothetical protein